MKKILFILFALVFFQASLEAQKLSKLLDHYYEATHAPELEQVPSLYMEMLLEQGGVQIPVTVYVKKPGKFRMEMEYQGQRAVTVSDGREGWSYVPWVSPAPRPLTGEEMEQLSQQFGLEDNLVDYEKKGFTAELAGKTEADGKECYKIILRKEGVHLTYYLDPQTWHVVKVEIEGDMRGQTFHTTVHNRAYGTFGKFSLPVEVETGVGNGLGHSSYTVTALRFDKEMPDTLFVKPAK